MLFRGTPDEPAAERPDAAIPRGGRPGDGRESWTAWLDRTERETWQMELLVAGFAIVLLATGLEPLERRFALLRGNAGEDFLGELVVGGLTSSVLLGYLFTLVNLVISVVLRSLWIAALGVRSFSGGIDRERLRLAPRFERFAARRLPAFDDYIVALESLCSAVFALTFLLFFAVLGVAVFIMVLIGGIVGIVYATGLDGDGAQPDALRLAGITAVGTLLVAALVAGLLYAFDFLSGGVLKRSRTLSRVYYPIYRALGWLTGARLYRPLYYNLVDHALGRRLVLGLVPYAVVVTTLVSYRGEHFTPLHPRDGDVGFASASAYLDADEGSFRFVARPHLRHAIAREGFLELFIPLHGNYVRLMLDSCAAVLEPHRESEPRDDVREVLRRHDAAVSCLAARHRLRVDGAAVPTPGLVFAEHERDVGTVLYGLLPTDTLARGRHVLSVERAGGPSDARHAHLVSIPFFVP